MDLELSDDNMFNLIGSVFPLKNLVENRLFRIIYDTMAASIS